jgi:hypothetical protein
MKAAIIILLCVVFGIILFFVLTKKKIETFKKGSNINQTFTSYEDVNYKKLCPSSFKEQKSYCNPTVGCPGPAEICISANPGAFACQCSLRNDCLYDAIC